MRIKADTSGRGLSLRITPTSGADSGGAERVWSAGDARGLAPSNEFEPESRLGAEVGYGFSVFGGRGVATPHAAWSRAEQSEAFRLRQRLKLGASRWSEPYQSGGSADVTDRACRRQPDRTRPIASDGRRRCRTGHH